MMRRLLLVIIVAELIGGGYLIARRLMRPAPPHADWTLLDAATAEQIQAALAACATPEDWRGLGELYMAAGCFGEAEICHRRACELDPKNAVFARQWAFALERLALLEEANAQYARAMELAPRWADACRYFIARNLLRAEKPVEASKVFSEGKGLSANRYELARLHLRAGALDEAKALFEDLARTGSDLLQVNLLGYRLALERGDPRQAFVLADRARYAPKKLQGPFDEEAERIIKATQRLGPGRLWKENRDLIAADRLKEAQASLEKAVQTERSSVTLELLAEIALRQNRFAAALGLLEEFQERHGPLARITARIGDVWDAAGQGTKARASWLLAAQLEAGVDLKATHHRLADSFAKAGDGESADRHRARGHYYVGRDLLHFGFAAKAGEYFAAAAKHDPTFTQAWFYLGEARRLTHQKEEAAAAYRSCLERNPHHGRALAGLAFLSEKKGE